MEGKRSSDYNYSCKGQLTSVTNQRGAPIWVPSFRHPAATSPTEVSEVMAILRRYRVWLAALLVGACLAHHWATSSTERLLRTFAASHDEAAPIVQAIRCASAGRLSDIAGLLHGVGSDGGHPLLERDEVGDPRPRLAVLLGADLDEVSVASFDRDAVASICGVVLHVSAPRSFWQRFSGGREQKTVVFLTLSRQLSGDWKIDDARLSCVDIVGAPSELR